MSTLVLVSLSGFHCVIRSAGLTLPFSPECYNHVRLLCTFHSRNEIFRWLSALETGNKNRLNFRARFKKTRYWRSVKQLNLTFLCNVNTAIKLLGNRLQIYSKNLMMYWIISCKHVKMIFLGLLPSLSWSTPKNDVKNYSESSHIIHNFQVMYWVPNPLWIAGVHRHNRVASTRYVQYHLDLSRSFLYFCSTFGMEHLAKILFAWITIQKQC